MRNTNTDHEADNFVTLLNFIADPAVIIDKKANFLLLNHAFEKITGYRSDEWVGKNISAADKLTPETISLLEENLQKRLQNIDVPSYEICIPDVNTENLYFELNAKKICYNNIESSVLVILREITRRKMVMQDLRENKEKMEELINEKVKELNNAAEKMRIIFDSSPDAISFIAPNGQLVDYNKVTLKLFGYSNTEEAKNLNIFDLIPPREQKRVALVLERIGKTGILQTERYTLLNKAGQEFPAEVSSSPVKDANGQLVGFVVNTKDISERKRLEDTLIESEEKFRAITNSAINAVILVDETDRVVYWNPSSEKMFGYTAQEALGKKIFDLIISPENRSAHTLMLNNFSKNKQNPHLHSFYEIVALRKDQTQFPVELSMSIIHLKGKKYLAGIIHDISNHKKMEDTIKQERDLLEKVTENISAGLAIISRDYRILWANKLLWQLHGGVNIQNNSCYTIFNTENNVCPDCGVKKLFAGIEQVNRHDFHFVKAGRQRCVELIVTPIKDKNGNIIAALELAIDVTEKRRLESQHSSKLERLVEERTIQLKETQEKLVKTERLAAIGELAAMVGHDLRNPLTGMKAATYYLKGKIRTDSNPKTLEMLELIDNCIDQSNKIVNDLLEYSRSVKLDITETDPSDFIKHAVSIIKPPKNVKVLLEAPKQGTVKFDSAKMQRVFLNIIKNAFDAMPKGGTLTINSKQTQKNWLITFIDSGEGMTQETLQKLGNPLFTTKAKGMGFGIPICKRIVEAHSGKLLIGSILGQGTTVTIKIPLKFEQAEPIQTCC